MSGGTFAFLRDKKIIFLSGLGTLACISTFVKDQMQGGRFKSAQRADGQVVLITGANTGIGRETAAELARRGAHVYMACRDLKRCEEARADIVLDSQNPNVFCRQCDLASFKSVRQFADKFKAEQPRLHILINNAGVMRCPQSTTADGIETQLGVNHMGHFLLTNLLLEPLQRAAPSRVVVLSSIAHTRGSINVTDLNSEQAAYDEAAAYNQSKLANVLFSRELARRLSGTGVTVNAVHPGIVDTELMRHMSWFNSWMAKCFIKPFVWPFLKTARSGAQTSLYAALDPSLVDSSGYYFSDCQLAEVSEAARDDAMARWLWAVSEKWTNLQQHQQQQPAAATSKEHEQLVGIVKDALM